ncbi:hypothetical protein V500_10173 [Pseudogymnoascus sp. VKM F-4518 (FW-2643)]|nr:hypothetical protein V500_10173 [Pseudogymnoascus sp. VKM F-4518 (FW-2643)]
MLKTARSRVRKGNATPEETAFVNTNDSENELNGKEGVAVVVFSPLLLLLSSRNSPVTAAFSPPTQAVVTAALEREKTQRGGGRGAP